jgi:tRNA A37 threonylcarbamoyltransferase TsaD
MGDNRPDFSFSGLKTAVQKYVRESGLQPVTNGEASIAKHQRSRRQFSEHGVRSLVSTMEKVAKEYHPKTLIVAGVSHATARCAKRVREAQSGWESPSIFRRPIIPRLTPPMIAAPAL